MKRYIFLAMFVAVALGIQAQYYMNLWYNDTLLKLPVLTIDSVTFTDYIPDAPTGPELPTEPTQIDALFSVGEGIVVSFSPGNLQYHPVNNTWRFAENQWDYVGEANANISATYDGWIDLFGWGTGDNPLKTSMNGDDYQTFVDWGTNQIGNDAPNTWRTLTKDEWMCLLYYRTNAESLFALGQVNGVNGLIILPDRWSTPEEVTFVPSTQQGLVWDKRDYSNAAADNFAHNVYTLEQWAIMQNAGAVFIPAAGNRKGTNTFYVNEIGYCWSSTKEGVIYAYNLLFGSTTLDLQRANYLYYAFPVRLAKNMVYVPDDQGISTTGTENGYEWVDLGLLSGVKWATCNVGANSPEEYGDYFAWGEVEPKDEYSWSTYKWCDGRSDALTKYNDQSSYGATDYKNFLDVEDDAAAVNLGGTWRTPTKMEFEELHGQCSWNWTTINGVDGYQVVGPNGNSIFLPAAGMYCDNDLGSFNIGTWGYYWTSLLDFSMYAYSSIFNNSYYYCYRNYTRIDGFPVRAVCNATNEEVPEEPEQPGEGVDPEPEPEPEPEPDPIEPYKSIGIFTVGEGKAISFAPGNLQYTQSTNTWAFASAQWEMLGTDNVTGGSVYSDPRDGDSKEGYALADKVDLFCWSTSATNFGVSTSTDNNDYSGSFVDWGTNKIGNDAPNTWRTLTGDEWNYLLKNRNNANDLCGVAQVNGVNGLIFLPDDWTCPAGITFKSGFHSSYGVDYYAANQTFTAEQWSKLEDAGAVFLPAAGYHYGSDVGYVQGRGYYWSATENDSDIAYYLYFYSDVANMNCHYRYDGRSVRLVRDVEDEPVEPEQPGEGGEEPEEPNPNTGNHEYVDLGLSVKWATCNVGANAPEEYGDYFAWGETEPKDYYDWSTYKWCRGSDDTQTKYNNSSSFGTVDNKITLELSDDAARANWGGSWRMPTHAEQDELRNNCTWTLTTQNGVTGYKVTGTNGNSIFLPAAGERYGSSLSSAGSGYYWSSSLDTDIPRIAYSLSFNSSGVSWSGIHRFYGLSVRPVCDTPDDVLPEEPEAPTQGIGVFSISADKQVTFSPGNLQYHPANNEWRFAENQTDYIGDANSNCSSTYDGWLDLFGWSTSSTNFGVSTSTDYNDYSGSFVDWGTNQIGSDAPNTWRTLTGDEWNYLLKDRTNASSLCGVAQVSGVNGLILLPDTWVCPEGISGFTPGFVEWEGEGYNQHQQFGPDTWAALEASGAIFLPAAGQRSGGSVGVVNKWGFYWSALTAYHNSSAYYLRIEDCGISMSQSSRDTGFSVRLVKDIEGGGATPDTPDTPTEPEEPENTENGYEYVDLGLSVKWATCNVGATKPEEYGDYFAWGEVEPKDTYDWSTYKWCEGSNTSLTKYCINSDYGLVDNKTTLEAADDAAQVNWGGVWRMPTHEEQEELRIQCTWTWTTQNGVTGYKVTSKKNGNSIFLPAAGDRFDSWLNLAGYYGKYWSSSLRTASPDYAYNLDFISDDVFWNYYDRYRGFPIRPVCQ